MIPLLQLLFLFLSVPLDVTPHHCHDLLISYFAFYLCSGIHASLNPWTVPSPMSSQSCWSVIWLWADTVLPILTALVRSGDSSPVGVFDQLWCVNSCLCLLNLLTNHLTWTYLFNMLNTTKHVFSWYYLYFLMWYKCRFYPLLCDTYVIRF